MTALPAANYISNSARTQGEAKTALESIVSFLRERIGSGSGWTSVASAATTDLSAQTSRMILVTGTTAITSFGTTAQNDNALFMVRFAGVLTLTNGANLILPTGANITTAAGDIALVVWEGSNVWRVIGYFRANGQALAQPTQILSTSYDSGNQTITSAGALALTHSLGAVPKVVTFLLVCQTAEFGFSVGDTIQVMPGTGSMVGGTNGTAAGSFVATLTSTQVKITFGGAAAVFQTVRSDNGNIAGLTNANWKFVVRAYA